MCASIDTSPTLFNSQLESPETNPENSPQPSVGGIPDELELAERFRHSGWQRNRDLIYQSLRRTMQSVSRINAFSSCGYSAFIYRTVEPPHRFRLGGSSCRDRFCVPCAIDRSRCLATNVLTALHDKPTRFMTLTLKQSSCTLAETLVRLYDCFRRLRARSYWLSHVKGGCAFLEMKWSAMNDAWNVHLHCIVHGSYFPARNLSKMWYKITGDSMIVDVRFVHDHARIGRYVTKYVSKPFNNTFVNRSDLLDEVIVATRGKRLCITFGDWRGIRLTESPNDADWIALGTFHDVVSRALRGDRECLQAVHEICGDDAPSILAAVERARPPPLEPLPPPSQMIFAWPQPDSRF